MIRVLAIRSSCRSTAVAPVGTPNWAPTCSFVSMEQTPFSYAYSHQFGAEYHSLMSHQTGASSAVVRAHMTLFTK